MLKFKYIVIGNIVRVWGQISSYFKVIATFYYSNNVTLGTVISWGTIRNISWHTVFSKLNNKAFQQDACRPLITVRGSLSGGGGVSLDRDPLDRDPLPWTETPQKEHWTRDRDPPRRNIGPVSQTGSDIIQRPPCGQTNTCKNITLSQTSFAGGNKYNIKRFALFLQVIHPVIVSILLIISLWSESKCKVENNFSLGF